MTRWARSGSTQRHKKLPSDPTPWTELSAKSSGSADSAAKDEEASRKGAKKGSAAPKKKEKFYDKVRKNREENGILLLPKNVESRLYRLKKSLRERGTPNENIKQILRQARRKAELQFRKTLKVCYNCRQTGHVLSACPLVERDPEQGTGICFKCGSTEHKSSQCHIKTSDYPFAKCFICKEQGHLSRNCPKNTHGAFPKGGKCNLCGKIDHLKKDCPLLQKKHADKSEDVTVDVINKMESVDEEKIEKKSNNVSVNISKKPKVVKF